jgi:hypothetical protein
MNGFMPVSCTPKVKGVFLCMEENSMRVQQTSQKPQPRRQRKWLRIILAIGLFLVILVGGLVAVPVVSPATGAALADDLRAIFGPEFVAQLESASFRIQDTVNRARYQASGGQPQLNWAQGTVTTTLQIKRPAKAAPTQAVIVASARPGAVANPQSPAAAPASPDVTVITAPSPADLAWQAYGAEVNGTPIMARSFVKPDPDRPFARAGLVRIDLAQVQLHLMPGTVEPVAATSLPHFKRPGFIPAADQNPDLLLAAFNGGFKAIHGHFGMMVDGATLLPPLDGLATIALRPDGSIQIGQWGRDLTANDKLTWYRQN